MQDTTISISTALASTLWAVGAGFILLNFFVEPPFGALGVFLGASASTVQIRGVISMMERRERMAFELGRDSVRSIR